MIKKWLKRVINSILLDNDSVQQLINNDISLSVYFVELDKRLDNIENKLVNGRILKEI